MAEAAAKVCAPFPRRMPLLLSSFGGLVDKYLWSNNAVIFTCGGGCPFYARCGSLSRSTGALFYVTFFFHTTK